MKFPRPNVSGNAVAAGLALAMVVTAQGIQPHEVLLLVNQSSVHSLAVANHYRHLRGVPDRNVVYLSLPDSVLEAEAEMSPGNFRKLIWEPAAEAMRARKLTEHVFIWAYSAGFPVRITSDPPVSLQGITFTRAELPPPREIAMGQYISPLYSGPFEAGGPRRPTLSFAGMTDMPFDERPVPSMMLAFTGARGNTLDASIRRIQDGVGSDGTFPKGRFFFVTQDDVRSRARDWAFEETVSDLAQKGFDALLADDMPKQGKDISGLMIGQSQIRGFRQNQYLAGSMAEHLTSFAAVFHHHAQMKCTRWLEGGVSATCGTVTEPMAIWMKFPHPRFFVHYTSGTHIVESFFQSVLSPMQLLILGDPLLAPWRPRPTLQVHPVDDGRPLNNKLRFRVESGHETSSTRFYCMLDGLFIQEESTENVFEVPLDNVEQGHHELRMIQSEPGSFGSVATQVAEFGLRKTSRAIALKRASNDSDAPIHEPIRLETQSDAPGQTVAILQGFRLLEQRPWQASASWVIAPRRLGPGPVTLQAAARYPDGNVVRSVPLRFDLVPPRKGPGLRFETRPAGSGQNLSLQAVTSPGAGVDWMKRVPLEGRATDADFGGTVQWSGNRLHLESNDGVSTLLMTSAKNKHAPTAISCRLLSTPSQQKGGVRMLSGILFNYRHVQGFDFFGVSAASSEWILGEFGNGLVKKIQARGARVKYREIYELTLRNGPEGDLEAWVNGELVLRVDQMKFGRGGAGLVLGHGAVQCDDFAITPVSKDSGVEIDRQALRIIDPPAAQGTVFRVVARMREAITQKNIRITGTGQPAFVPVHSAKSGK